MNYDGERQQIVRIARGWIGTPFHDCASIRGVGADCAGLVAGVYRESGLVPGGVEFQHAEPQWYLHRSEERLVEGLIKYAREIKSDDAGPGDVVTYLVGRCHGHVAIVVDWPREVIHAHMQSRAVIAGGAFEGEFRTRRTVRFFSIWGA